MEKLPGMPDLAPGYFWKLRLDSDNDLRVELRKRRWFFSYTVGYTFVLTPSELPAHKLADELVRAGNNLIRNFNRAAEVKKLVGEWK